MKEEALEGTPIAAVMIVTLRGPGGIRKVIKVPVEFRLVNGEVR